jgi:hypothetical protein
MPDDANLFSPASVKSRINRVTQQCSFAGTSTSVIVASPGARCVPIATAFSMPTLPMYC